jgi:hypothetical protein
METPGIVAGGGTDLAIARAIIGAQIGAGDNYDAKMAAVGGLTGNQQILDTIQAASDKESQAYQLYNSLGALAVPGPDAVNAADLGAIIQGGTSLRANQASTGIDVLPPKSPPTAPFTAIFPIAALAYGLYWIFK